jgi:secreted PhoX family phosphatase
MRISEIGRRSFLQQSLALAGCTTVTGTLGALFARQAGAAGLLAPVPGPYGPIAPVRDLETGLFLLQLPQGFSYRSFGWSGDRMRNGQPTPQNHDGMAVVAFGAETVLIRNHENGVVPGYGLIDAKACYDKAFLAEGPLSGGNTVLRCRNGRWVDSAPALGGTSTNCCGGPTPWGTWLTCEETLNDFSEVGGRKHGYVFEVSADPQRTSGNPIVAMGRMRHEAVAVDPRTGAVYLSEDANHVSGFYRYIPNDTGGAVGALERGGRLSMARVAGTRSADLMAPAMGETYRIAWVPIAEPDAGPAMYGEDVASGPFLQGRDAGALRVSRGEGIWYSGGAIYMVDTAAGRDTAGVAGNGLGAVWRYDPVAETLTAIYVSENPVAGNHPDNITVSPRGGILFCEDGGGATDAFGFGERLMGLTARGESYIFAKNNIMLSAQDIAAAGKSAEFVPPADYRENEWAGACFDRAGTLFVNIQTPGVTFAITGPWPRGNL